jgi:cytidine deaminase
MTNTGFEDEEIRGQLKKLTSNAYAPYSNFRVAAALVDEQDRLHFGVNVENQSYPVATCAEAAAIAAMRAAGGRHIKRIYLLSDPNVEVVPCGACRQRLAELGDDETCIVTFRADGGRKAFKLRELFPMSFRFK